jgi:hypothetical protein
MLSVIMLSVFMVNVIMLSAIRLSVIRLSVIMVSVIKLSVIMVSVIMLSVIMLNVANMSGYAEYRGAFWSQLFHDQIAMDYKIGLQNRTCKLVLRNEKWMCRLALSFYFKLGRFSIMQVMHEIPSNPGFVLSVGPCP